MAMLKQSTGGSLNIDPMVIDLDGDGLELTRLETGTHFDIDIDGFAEKTAWVGKDDGLLARDLNGNGAVKIVTSANDDWTAQWKSTLAAASLVESLAERTNKTVAQELSGSTRSMVFALSYEHDPRKLSYGANALDGDPNRVGPLDLTHDGGANIWEASKDSGRPLNAEFMPTKISLKGPKARLHDIWPCHGMYCVSRGFRETVEALEQNVHQFFPVDVFWSDGTPYESMFLFNCCSRIESVDRTHTTMELVHGIWNHPKIGSSNFVFSIVGVRGHHVWRDKHIVFGTFLSKQLADALQTNQVGGVKLMHFDEV